MTEIEEEKLWIWWLPEVAYGQSQESEEGKEEKENPNLEGFEEAKPITNGRKR